MFFQKKNRGSSNVQFSIFLRLSILDHVFYGIAFEVTKGFSLWCVKVFSEDKVTVSNTPSGGSMIICLF